MTKLPCIFVSVDHKGIHLNELLEEVKRTPGKKLKEINFWDFILNEPKDYEMNHGVYIFKRDTYKIYWKSKFSPIY